MDTARTAVYTRMAHTIEARGSTDAALAGYSPSDRIELKN